MSNKGDYAKRILFHYVSMAMRDHGRQVDSDTRAELDGAIDDIIEAAAERAVKAIEDRSELNQVTGYLFDYNEPLH